MIRESGSTKQVEMKWDVLRTKKRYLLVKPWGIGPGHLLRWAGAARGKVVRRAAFQNKSWRKRWAHWLLTQDKVGQWEIGRRMKISISRWCGSLAKAESAQERWLFDIKWRIGSRGRRIWAINKSKFHNLVPICWVKMMMNTYIYIPFQTISWEDRYMPFSPFIFHTLLSTYSNIYLNQSIVFTIYYLLFT